MRRVLVMLGLLVVACDHRKDVIGRWSVVKSPTNCGGWAAGSENEWTFAPKGEAEHHTSFQKGDGGTLWAFHKGRWTLSGSTIEVDIRETVMEGGTLKDRSVDTYRYLRDGSTLKLSQQSNKWYGQNSYAEQRTMNPGEDCAVAFTKTNDLVE